MGHDGEDVVERIKASFKAYGGSKVTDETIHAYLNCVKDSKQKLLLHKPRRGVHVEYGTCLPLINEQLADQAGKAGVAFDAAVQPTQELKKLECAEQWRDTECLAVSPATFQALKQLPELQQLIAFTAADVVTDRRYTRAFLATVGFAYEEAVAISSSAKGPAPSMQQLLQAASAGEESQAWAGQVNAEGSPGVALALSPHLRLALAAEVAAGMLCRGTPAPPDTPEHGSALKLFAVAGLQRLRGELKEAAAAAAAAHTSDASNSSNPGGGSSSSSGRSKPTRLQKVWAHVPGLVPQQSGQHCGPQAQAAEVEADTPAGVDLLPPASQVRSWPLSPHIDLQLQVPPHLLLQQMVLLAAQLCRDQQQREGQGEAAAAAGSDSREAQQEGQLPGRHITLLHEALQQLDQQALQQGHRDAWLLKACPWAALLRGSDAVEQLQSAFADVSCSGMGRGGSLLGVDGSCVVQSSAAQAPAAPAATASPAGPTSAAPEAAGPAAQAAAQASATGSIALLQQLCEATVSMAARCLVEQVLQGNQDQALPLQALQLLAAVRQLQATAQAASSLATVAAAGAAATDETIASPAGVQQGVVIQLLVQQAVALVQHVSALGDTAAAAAAAASNSLGVHARSSGSSTASSSRGSSDSSSSVGGEGGACCAAGSKTPGPLSPSEFFAADGPLSSSWGCREPLAGVPGLWGTAAAAPPAAGTQGRGQVAPGSTPASMQDQQHQQHQQQQQQQEELTSQVLLASAACDMQLRHVYGELSQLLKDPSLPNAVRVIQNINVETLQQQRLLIEYKRLDRAEAWLREAGLTCYPGGVLGVWMLPGTLAAVVLQLRAALCLRHGLPPYSAAAWQAQLGYQVFEGATGAASLDLQAGSSDSDDWDAVGEEGEDPVSCSADAAGAGWGSAPSSTSSSGGSSHPGQWQTPQAAEATQQLVQRLVLDSSEESPRGCSVDQSDRQTFEAAVSEGAASLRQLAGCAAAKFAPLQQWHAQHVVQQQQAAVQAQEWWGSRERLEAAVAGATGKPLHSAATGTKQGGSSSRSSTAAAPGTRGADSGSSSSGSSPCLWPHGLHDHHPHCPLCAEEQQQQQQQQEQQQRQGAKAQLGATAPSSSSSSVYAAWPVSYDDPFMWRRLMWQLLGKLSPEAQAFYSTYLAMCPHCTDERSWSHVVFSINRCLGVPVGTDVAHLSLLGGSGLVQPDSRDRFMRQFSRAINTAHAKAYHPCTPLLAKQVLLALSPLHHQLLPPPEVAHLLPSSVVPAVGKTLMQQVMPQSVLAGFAHKDAQVHPWHVFWHVGLRRHHWLRQQQQAQQQLHQQWAQPQTQGQKAAQQVAEGRDSSSAAWVPPEQAYLDADARLYAVGFATRQLAADTRTSHLGSLLGSSACSSGAQQQASIAASRVLLRLAHSGLSHSIKQGDSSSEALRATQLKELPLVGVFAIERVLLPAAPLLDDVLLGPGDPLVPLQQQRRRLSRSLGKQSTASRYHHIFARSAAEAYVELVDPTVLKQMQHPLVADLVRAHEQQQQQQERKEEEGEAQRLLPQQQQCLEGASDSFALMLAPPVPAECLLPPEVWWGWQKRVLGLDKCDTCGTHCTAGQVFTCADCKACVYCSAACRRADGQHTHICERLRATQQRYGPKASSSSSSGDGGSGSGSMRHAALLQQLLQQSAAATALTLPGLPILSSLLQPSVHEPGPLGPWQEGGAVRDWPKGYANTCMEQILTLLTDDVAAPSSRRTGGAA